MAYVPTRRTPLLVEAYFDVDVKTLIGKAGGFVKARKPSLAEIREQSH